MQCKDNETQINHLCFVCNPGDDEVIIIMMVAFNYTLTLDVKKQFHEFKSQVKIINEIKNKVLSSIWT